jgi:hypothetical protein
MATPTNLPASFSVGQTLTAANMNNIRGAFRVLQVITATNSTLVGTGSTTMSDTGLTVNITPSATSSKILVFAVGTGATTASGQGVSYRLMRGSTEIRKANNIIYDGYLGTQGNWTFLYLDSPATTSATTYKIQFALGVGSGTVYNNPDTNTSDIVVCEISA